MLKSYLGLDFETYCDLDIKKVGAHKYSQHPSCEVLLASYRINKSKIKLWDATAEPMPKELKRRFEDPNVVITAFNAQFERLILKHVLGYDIPIERFQCTMVWAYGLSFAGNLDMVGKATGLPQDKQKLAIGKKLLRRFTQPAPSNHKADRYDKTTHPQEWEQFKLYCINDTEAEQALLDVFRPYPLRDQEWEQWYHDQEVNDRGLPVDLTLVNNAIKLAEQEKETVIKEMRRITKLENPNSRDQLLGWLQENGVEVDDLRAATVDKLSKIKFKKRNISKVITLKQRINKSSVSKYEALKRAEHNGRIYGTLQFMGASRTGRDAGRIFQPQNLPRTPEDWNVPASIAGILEETITDDIFFHLAYSIRGAIKAPKKKKLVVTDLSGIEGRVLPWLCGYQEKLDKIEGGLEMYKVAASGIYNTPYEKVTKDQRICGKVAELALGYQGSLGALNNMADGYGLPPFEEEQGMEIVNGWRASNRPIQLFWWNVEKAAILAIKHHNDSYTVQKLEFFMDGDFLVMLLPSGRNIYYYKPEVDRNGKISYMGLNSFTHKWERIYTYGGKLVENATQAVARDIMFERQPSVERAGYQIILRVHDELVTETSRAKKYSESKLSKLLAAGSVWTAGLPLAAEGYEANEYRK